MGNFSAINVVCTMVNSLSKVDRCQFVRTTPDCKDNMNLINYLALIYCINTSHWFFVICGLLVLTLLCFYLFWFMNLATREYFCPTLKSISDILNLNENAAGVTILALANGSPDIFVSIVSVMEISKFAYLQCLSKAIFLHLFVGGLVILVHPFYMQPSYFLRDFGFLFLTIIAMDYIHKRSQAIHVYEALGVASLYILHCMVALLDQGLLKIKIGYLKKKLTRSKNDETESNLVQLQSMGMLPVARSMKIILRYGPKNENLMKQFWTTTVKFNKRHYHRANLCVKIFMLLKLPLEVTLRIFLPVVNMEEPNDGWSKLVCCLQIVIVPLFLGFVFLRQKVIHGVSSVLYLFVVSLILSLFVFWRTRTDTKPPCFYIMAFVGFFTVIVLIFYISSEIMAIFFTIGTVLGISQPMMLATVACWSLSMNDLISCVALSRQGLPRMAYAGCFATPVFGTFAGLSLPLVLETLISDSKTVFPFESSFGETCGIFLLIGMTFVLLTSLTTNFMMRRLCGYFSVLFYLMFLAILILLERDIVLSYGVDLRQ